MAPPNMADARYTSYGLRGRDLAPSSPRDRRRACRYPVDIPGGALGWREGESFADAPCRIIDISAGGCMVELLRGPSWKERQSVWLRPPGVGPDDWTEGIIVAVRKPFLRPCRVRISFLAELPYELYKALAFGAGRPRAAAGSAAPEHEKDHFWR
jgi:hypothetical protein